MDEHAEDPAAAGQLADRVTRRLVEAVGDEPLQASAAPVDHAERRVARAGELGGDPHERLQDGVERELRGDRDPGLDERAPSVVLVHVHIQHVRNAAPAISRQNSRRCHRFQSRRARRRAPVATLVIAIAVAAVVAVALIAGSVVLTRGGSKDATATTTGPSGSAAAPVALVAGIPQSGTTLGNPKATTKMLIYEDMQCPYCKKFTDDALPAIINEYVKPGRLKLDWRGLAFLGPDSTKALQIALAAGKQNKLWEVIGLLYEKQGAENSGWVTDQVIDDVLAAVPGLDAAKVKADAKIDRGAWIRSRRSRTRRRPISVGGTPSFFIVKGVNQPYQLQVALTPEAFRPALNDALKG